jgi:hypothetical protein
MLYAVKNGQGIYDVAVLLYGDAQYSVKLCNDNGLTITDSIVGLTLIYDETIKPKKLKRLPSSKRTRQSNPTTHTSSSRCSPFGIWH